MSGTTPPFTVQEFRALLPVFGNAEEYPDDTLTYWIQDAADQLDPLVWASLWSKGVMLYTAHTLELFRRLGGDSNNGVVGLELSKTVGKVSVDYDTTATSMKDGGPFNTTTWGTQFLFYARMVGAGPRQITGTMRTPPGGAPYVI